MSKVVYKIRDINTGAFWNGDPRWSKFNAEGKSWKTKKAAESTIGSYYRYGQRFDVENFKNLPAKWEIVSFKIKEEETSAEGISELVEFFKLRSAVDEQDTSFGYFLDTMRKKGVIDDIEFIFKLKKEESKWRVTREEVIEARAQLRQLNIKTRTFREYQGMFGMMNREQALRARLTLNVDSFIDLGALRKKL